MLYALIRANLRYLDLTMVVNLVMVMVSTYQHGNMLVELCVSYMQDIGE
eukprot:SAG11_NODE_235_length_11852_cov_4.266020_2_plen_49_part_00